jgi:hypothetical protein
MTRRKLLPLSGIAAVLLIALSVVLGGSSPDPDASAASVTSFYDAHHGREVAAAFVLAASVPFLAFFVAALATVWPREPGERPAWELVLVGGGALAGGAILLAAAVHFALADGAKHLSASGLQVLNALDGNSWVAWNAGIGVMMLGAGGSLVSRAAGSRWLARTAVALGILLFIPFADFFALLATGLWILVARVYASVGAEPRVGMRAQAVA